MKEEKLYSVKEMLHLWHVTRKQLYIYEEKGLIKPVRNEDNRYRYYTQWQALQIEFIRECRDLGFSFDSISDMMKDMTPRTLQRSIKQAMSDKEYEKMCRKIKSLWIRNHAAYLRKMALDGYCIQLDIPEIKEMTALLGRCSGNLNQYAKKANQTGSIYKRDITDLRVRLDQIYEQTEKVLAALNELQY